MDEKRMVERVARSVVSGTWALPKDGSDVKKLVKIYNHLRAGNLSGGVNSKIYPLLGDDGLFDNLDKAKRKYQNSCAIYLKKRARELAEQPAESFADFGEYEALQELVKNLH